MAQIDLKGAAFACVGQRNLPLSVNPHALRQACGFRLALKQTASIRAVCLITSVIGHCSPPSVDLRADARQRLGADRRALRGSLAVGSFRHSC